MSALQPLATAQVRLPYGYAGSARLLHAALDPAIAIACLLLCAAAGGVAFDGPYVILSLLVFSLTFPGSDVECMGALRQFGRLAGEWLPACGLLLLVGWASATLGAFDVRVLAAWVVLTPFAMLASHRALSGSLPRMLGARLARKKAVIAVWNAAGRGLAERIATLPLLGIDIAGYFDDRDPARLQCDDAVRRLGGLEQLAEHVKTQGIGVIYICHPMASQPRIVGLLEALRDTTVSIYFVPDIFLCDLIQARVETIGGMPVLAVCDTPFRGIDAVFKRLADIALAGAFLLAFAPLMLAIAAGIKLSSRGPVLFRQRRYGLDGREIVVFKFRSMRVVEDGAEVRQAQRVDSRVTPFGAFLRASSLDELPQFLNVLAGSMSVVGPRPHAVAHNETYRRLISGYMIRHKVKPGITGLAQVNGARGETETVDKMRLRVEYDLAYVRNWSLQLDLRILFKTVVVVLGRHNAY